MDDQFVRILDQIRAASGVPMVVTSGYRCLEHPIEVVKIRPGPHTTGKAADISCHGPRAREILTRALELGVNGIGLDQASDISTRFIHLDICEDGPGRPRPWIWTY